MKFPTFLLTLLLGVCVIAPGVDARGEKREGGGGGGRSKASAPKRSSAPEKRSPMTGSKIERPKAKPQPKQVSRPEAAKPADRAAERPQSRPAQRPQAKPEARPTQRPSVQKPANRPETRPAQKPGENRPGENRPGNNRPGENRPGNNRPDNRPSMNRPNSNRPSTLPGMVTYPNRPNQGKPNRPDAGNRPDRNNVNAGNTINAGNRVNTGDRNRVTKIDNSRRNSVHIVNVNVGRRNVGLNRPANRPVNNRNWDSNRWGGSRGVWGNGGDNVNVNINNNFRYNNNYSYRPNYWGARPWWGAGVSHTWHHGHWNYGYNSNYYSRHWYHDDDDFASGFMWGIGVWSLGNLIYDMGYQSYKNPYPAPPVQSQSSKTTITYTEPVSVAAAALPPGDEAATESAEKQSNEALERSRTAFKQGDYISASKAVDEAIGYTPGDVTLHEYRALVLFALGKFSDAAGVLNPVLASGPGWSWDTMIAFYNGSEAYNNQLAVLEDHVKGSPDKADARFLLGYHYMVCGYMDESYAQFAKASELQPADSISRQLRDLTKSSIPDEGSAEEEPEPPARPDPVPTEKLVGTWVSDRGADGKVTFTMSEDGNYTWAFMNAGKSSELKGTYGLDDKGLLVLTSDDTQMVSVIEMKEDSKLHFTLVGAPDGDPGLDFTKG